MYFPPSTQSDTMSLPTHSLPTATAPPTQPPPTTTITMQAIASAFPLTTLILKVLFKLTQLVIEVFRDLFTLIEALPERNLFSKLVRIVVWAVLMRRLLGFVLSRAGVGIGSLAGLQSETQSGSGSASAFVPKSGPGPGYEFEHVSERKHESKSNPKRLPEPEPVLETEPEPDPTSESKPELDLGPDVCDPNTGDEASPEAGSTTGLPVPNANSTSTSDATPQTEIGSESEPELESIVELKPELDPGPDATDPSTGDEASSDAASMPGSSVLNADSTSFAEAILQTQVESGFESTATSDSDSTSDHGGSESQVQSESPSQSEGEDDDEDETVILTIDIKRQDEEKEELVSSPVESHAESCEYGPPAQELIQEEEEPEFGVDQDRTTDANAGVNTSTSTLISTSSSTDTGTASNFWAAHTAVQYLPPALSRARSQPLLLLGPAPPPPSSSPAPAPVALSTSPTSLASKANLAFSKLPSLPGLPPDIFKLDPSTPWKASFANRSKSREDGEEHELEFELKLTGYVDLSNLPDYIEVNEPVSDDAFEIAYINEEIGFGLFATRTIRAGEIIFIDKLLTVWDEEESACQSRAEASALLERKAKMLGEKWYADYLHFTKGEGIRRKFAGSERKVAGVMGLFWEKCSLPTAWNSKVGSVFGLNLAYLNHACAPNCTLRYMNKYATDENGGILWDRPPKSEKAVLRACREIPAATEINFAYMLTYGSTATRREQTRQRFNFACCCKDCIVDFTDAAHALEDYRGLVNSILNPNVLADASAAALKAAGTAVHSLRKGEIYDARLVDIMTKCALIAGHHSDVARAVTFLEQTRDLVLVTEGVMSNTLRQIKGWLNNITSMPGFGATVRGLSAKAEASIFKKDDEDRHTMLFMLEGDLEDYKRVSRYRIVGDIDELDNGLGAAVTTEGQRWEVVDGLDPAPPKLYVAKAKLPQDMCRCHHDCRAAERVDGIARRRQAQRKGNKFSKRKACKKIDPQCKGPMKDFLACFRGVVREMFGEEALNLADGWHDTDAACCEEAEQKTKGKICHCGAHKFRTQKRRRNKTKQTPNPKPVMKIVKGEKKPNVVVGGEVKGLNLSDYT